MSRPVRLCQVIENLHTGAVENWLVRTFRYSRGRYPNYEWTFYCTLGRPGRLDDQVRAAGGRIVYSPHPINRQPAFSRHLRATVVAGRFDVLHCHHDLISGFYLAATIGLPVGRRFVHVHNTDEALPTPSRLKHRLLVEPLRRTCLTLADEVVGISTHTLAYFLKGLRPRGRSRVVYYAVDTGRFAGPPPDRAAFRAGLGLSPDAVVLLFVGRMDPLKNPLFAVDVLAEVARQVPAAVGVFAGVGELEGAVRARAAERGVADRVRMLGWRDDTAALMRSSDVFLFPRLEHPKEGLGLVLVEAQAAGLPVLLSPSVSPDVEVVPGLFETLPLAAGPAAWAGRVAAMHIRPRPDPDVCRRAVEASPFGLANGVDGLMGLYPRP